MTPKRFTILYGLDEDPFDWDILDNEKDAIICQYNGTPICGLLNELHEENENLKDVNVQCCNDYSAMRRDVLRYKEENEQLKQQLKELKEDVPLLLAFYRWYPFAVEKKEHQAYNRLWDFVND